MDRKRKVVAAGSGLYAIALYLSHGRKKRRSKWVKSWILEREENSHMGLIRHLSIHEPDDLKNYLRMSQRNFDALLEMVGSKLQKKNTVMRKSISPEERLAATLRFLATGRSYEDLKFSTLIAAQTLGRIIPETCQIIFETLKDEYMKMPQSKEEWKQVADGFKRKWQMINCGGCIDGKHIRIMKPKNSGALCYNYKKFYSIVLMAIVNADYEFLYVDVGKLGRLSDGGVIEATSFHDTLTMGSLSLPTNEETDENLNFVFVADEAFGLNGNILKPYPQRTLNYERRIYNYRISRSRNAVENAFGLITTRFRILHTAINLEPSKVVYIVLAVCALHNYLMRSSSSYCNSKIVDRENPVTHASEPGFWRNESDNFELVPLHSPSIPRFPTLSASNNREKYLSFFNNKGKLSWQHEMIEKGKA